jgi:ankyrin repeat protein
LTSSIHLPNLDADKNYWYHVQKADEAEQRLQPMRSGTSTSVSGLSGISRHLGVQLGIDQLGQDLRALESAFVSACRQGRLSLLEALLDFAKPPADYNYDPLMVAAVSGHQRDVVRHLLGLGASPNATDTINGSSVLYDAVRLNQPDMVKMLLDYGADPGLEADGNDSSPLWLAASLAQLEIVRHLLRKKADVNAWTHNISVLGKAIESGSIECVKLLIEHGADETQVVSDWWEAEL